MQGPQRGQRMLVHRAARVRPDSGHMHVFTPSPFGKATEGTHSSRSRGGSKQRILVQRASLLTPSSGHTQVLQPSSAVKSIPRQQTSAPRPTSSSLSSPLSSPPSDSGGAAGHCNLVQFASAFLPLSGHMQVFAPSPFGKATFGVHSTALGGGKKHCILVHFAALRRPLAGQTQVLQPSSAVNEVPAQHISPSAMPSSGCPVVGATGHRNSVHSAPLLRPLPGHVQVFRPSPAG